MKGSWSSAAEAAMLVVGVSPRVRGMQRGHVLGFSTRV